MLDYLVYFTQIELQRMTAIIPKDTIAFLEELIIEVAVAVLVTVTPIVEELSTVVVVVLAHLTSMSSAH